MILLDVNVLVHSARRGSPQHQVARQVLLDVLTGDRPVGMLDETLTAAVRILTHPRLGPAQTPGEALSFCTSVRDAPATTHLVPPDAAWGAFAELVRRLDLCANDIPDAWLAAVARTSDATLLTFDRGFRRFEGLDVRVLGDPAGATASGSTAIDSTEPG